jgi:hypothetical protein
MLETPVVCQVTCSQVQAFVASIEEIYMSSENDLYFSRVIKSRIMKWAGHVARMGERSIQGVGGET